MVQVSLFPLRSFTGCKFSESLQIFLPRTLNIGSLIIPLIHRVKDFKDPAPNVLEPSQINHTFSLQRPIPGSLNPTECLRHSIPLTYDVMMDEDDRLIFMFHIPDLEIRMNMKNKNKKKVY